ncbi:MAG TPA: hypothetical protein VFS43_42790 [Polyangiaceae bacterium]|nr:hypothetical protein [Polyangiaceae bacterium]
MGAFREGARWLVPLALASALQLAGAPAQAQNSTSKADAFVLFKRGRLLMEAKRYGEACSLFAESYRLDPTGGTLLNLAYCNEQDNRTATAWAYYQDLLDRSLREKRNDRARYAQERLAALEPKLPRWTLLIGTNEKLSGVEVLRDGQSVPRPLWGTPVPVDPGTHQVEVRATDHKHWTGTFRAVAAQAATTEVPPLEMQPATPPASAPESEAPTPATLIVEAPRESLPPAEAPHSAPGSSTGRTVAGAILGGVGALGLGLGTYFGLTAFARHDKVQSLCRGPDGCEGAERADADELNQEGRLYAHLSTASFGVGVVGLGLGAYLLFIAPGPSSKASASTSVVPQIAPRSAGLSLTHTW